MVQTRHLILQKRYLKQPSNKTKHENVFLIIEIQGKLDFTVPLRPLLAYPQLAFIFQQILQVNVLKAV